MKPELESEYTFSSQVMELVNHKLAFSLMKARILMNFPSKSFESNSRVGVLFNLWPLCFPNVPLPLLSKWWYILLKEKQERVYISLLKINLVCTIKQTILYHWERLFIQFYFVISRALMHFRIEIHLFLWHHLQNLISCVII